MPAVIPRVIRVLFFLLLALTAGAASRTEALDAARQARELLGPETWAEVVLVRNDEPDDLYPAAFPALVFELERRLWCYVPGRGTQSLSIYGGRLEADKAEVGALLREMRGGFAAHEVIDPPGAPVAPSLLAARLPAGCFVESVAELRRMIAAGAPPDVARLLAYYGAAGSGQPGHTVLYLERGGERLWFDPEEPGRVSRLPATVPVDALAIARAVAPGGPYVPPKAAKFLPLQLPLRSDAGLPSDETAVLGP